MTILPPSSPFTLPWRWRQHGPPKRCYPTTSLHYVATQKTKIWNFITSRVCSVEFVAFPGVLMYSQCILLQVAVVPEISCPSSKSRGNSLCIDTHGHILMTHLLEKTSAVVFYKITTCQFFSLRYGWKSRRHYYETMGNTSWWTNVIPTQYSSLVWTEFAKRIIAIYQSLH